MLLFFRRGNDVVSTPSCIVIKVGVLIVRDEPYESFSLAREMVVEDNKVIDDLDVFTNFRFISIFYRY